MDEQRRTFRSLALRDGWIVAGAEEMDGLRPAEPLAARHQRKHTNGLLRQYFPRGTDLSRHSADDLAAVAAALDSLRSRGTRMVDARGLTLLPAFVDTHEHLLDSARDLARVWLEGAGSLAELVGLIRERAERTPAGQWTQTSGWNESESGREPASDRN